MFMCEFIELLLTLTPVYIYSEAAVSIQTPLLLHTNCVILNLPSCQCVFGRVIYSDLLLWRSRSQVHSGVCLFVLKMCQELDWSAPVTTEKTHTSVCVRSCNSCSMCALGKKYKSSKSKVLFIDGLDKMARRPRSGRG